MPFIIFYQICLITYKYIIRITNDKLDEKEIKELNDCIAKHRPSYRIYIKLIAVRYVKSGKTRIEVAKNLRVNGRTVEIG